MTKMVAEMPSKAADPAWVGGLDFTGLVSLIERDAGPPIRVIPYYRAWIAANPASPVLYAAWFNIGVLWANAGDPANACLAYRSALSLRPDFHAAALNLGTLLEKIGDQAGALQAWTSGLQPVAARTALLNQRARLSEKMVLLDEAERLMRASLQTDPQQPDVIQHWVHVRQKMCLWPPLAPEMIDGMSMEALTMGCGPLGVLALSDDVALQSAVSGNWLQRKTVAAPRRLSPAEGYDHPVIRIGYLSSDFCRHAMSFLVAELFERHDRARFRVYGYCFSREDGSDIRARVIAAFDCFTRVGALSDEQAAAAIRADEIDVLIDLNGLTAGARPQILRWRPAPVQATYLGFVGPTPLPELDYLFCDDIVVPAALAGDYAPTPYPIATIYQANDTKRGSAAAMTRAEAGLPEDRFVFCCMAQHFKVTEAVFGAWMQILAATGDSVLWLAYDNVASSRNLLARAAAAGIDPARIILSQRVAPEQYMAWLALADLFLDTFPYNAGTVASDAIRMRLPLLTLSGRAFASRMAGRLLTAIGATAGVTETLDDYVATAVALATDRDRYQAYKAHFRDDSWATTIGDMDRFTREYEASLARIVRNPAVDPAEASGQH